MFKLMDKEIIANLHNYFFLNWLYDKYFLLLDTISEDSDLPMTRILCHPRSVVNSFAVMVSAAIWSILDPTLEPHLRVVGLYFSIYAILDQ